MTTVINLNILNFFRLEFSKFKLKNSSLDALVSDGRRDRPPGREEIIDVTPFSRAVSHNEDNNERDLSSFKLYNTGPAIYPTSVSILYDREGKTLHCVCPKGMRIDSYA